MEMIVLGVVGAIGACVIIFLVKSKGIVGTITSIRNVLTGDAASVSVAADHPSLGVPFTVIITVQVNDQDIKCHRVYLKIRGVEITEIPDVKVYNATGKRVVKKISRVVNTLERQFDVATPQQLSSSQPYVWEYELNLPRTALPEYRGKYARHVYQIQAGLSTLGTDPNSGWIDLHMNRT